MFDLSFVLSRSSHPFSLLFMAAGYGEFLGSSGCGAIRFQSFFSFLFLDFLLISFVFLLGCLSVITDDLRVVHVT